MYVHARKEELSWTDYAGQKGTSLRTYEVLLLSSLPAFLLARRNANVYGVQSVYHGGRVHRPRDIYISRITIEHAYRHMNVDS
jgi:hypothetical protein